ncbi:MAG TPA: hypothetical protein VNV16_14930 [Methylibium sp.]|nr:hypothetical protein [Methylibium sp.]
MADYSYLGSGKIWLREIDGSGGLEHVGNASALNFSVTEDIKELKDYTQPGGGTYNEVRRISAVEMQATIHDVNSANLARALYGEASTEASATVTDEAHADIVIGALIPTDFLPSSITTVKRGATTLTENSDYTVEPSGIVPLSGGANTVIAGDDLLITYAKATQDVVEALVNAGKEYELLFDGLNEARSGKLVRVRAWRVKVGALQNLGLIGDEYAAMEVSGKLLKDTSITGAGLSQYFKVEIQA